MSAPAPWSQRAEREVIGAFLRWPQLRDEHDLRPEECYLDAHRLILAAIDAVRARGGVVTVATVAEDLSRDHALDRAGGVAELAALTETLADEIATPGATAHHVAIIRAHARRRALAALGLTLATRSHDLDVDVDELLAEAERGLMLAAEGRADRRPRTMLDVIGRVMDGIRARYQGEEIGTTPTGFGALDDLLAGGLRAPDVVVIAGRPAMGKSAFGMAVAENIARQGRRVLAFHLEMDDIQVGQRMLAGDATVPLKAIRARVAGPEIARLVTSAAALADLPLLIEDRPGLTIDQVRSICRRTAARGGPLGAVLVDYLQLMAGQRQRGDNREQEVAQISRTLKLIAKELQCPVIALSQLSRACELRSDKRPMLSDLRESGSIEQDADIVMFLYRDEVYDKESPDKGVAEVIVAKQRNGPCNTACVAFIGQYTKFANLTWRTP